MSAPTLDNLSKVSSINTSFSMLEGNNLTIKTATNTIVAYLQFEEYIPRRWSVFGLPKFINSIKNSFNTGDELIMDFENEHFVVIESEDRRLVFRDAEHEVVASSTIDKDLRYKGSDFKLKQQLLISKNNLEAIKKSSGAMGLTHVKFVSDSQGVFIKAFTPTRTGREDEANNISIKLTDATDVEFDCVIKIENFVHITTLDYNVFVYEAGEMELINFSAINPTIKKLDFVIPLEED